MARLFNSKSDDATPDDSEFADRLSYAWSPIDTRDGVAWPNHARVAIAIIVLLEAENTASLSKGFGALLPGGGGARKAYPDVQCFTHREYGHRVGIFRLLDLFRSYSFPVTVAMDTLTASQYPRVVQACLDADACFLAHGRSAAAIVTSAMTLGEERAMIVGSSENISHALGVQPRGWLGQAYSESEHTLDLLASQGYEFVCDWCNDDQPFQMECHAATLINVPTLYELDDARAVLVRGVSDRTYAVMLQDAFAQLHSEGIEVPRTMVFCVRPWVMGQAARLPILDHFLQFIADQEDTWSATPTDIVAAYRHSTAMSGR